MTVIATKYILNVFIAFITQFCRYLHYFTLNLNQISRSNISSFLFKYIQNVFKV